MSTTTAIREEINQLHPGELFTTNAFLGLGSRASIDQALSREARAGRIERVTRGVYMRPKRSQTLGLMERPSAEEVARKIVEEEGGKLQVHGAEAARRLGLSTQMQMQHIFLTDGARHQFRLGKATVTIKPVSPKKLVLAGSPAGLAHIALLYLGKDKVDQSVLTKIGRQLPSDELNALFAASRVMPGWLNETLRQFATSREIPT